ncbi:hypothetical protein DCC85_20185 [Paenibacillus sp. CAA11]|uniref:hypothetical protein n=1 Tax=Paenibacillus sp. CAA11 TaxID=1532905 RepID=UPI000D33E574|nr:hypothetical protein [Paenibacillus sp. CAA11]AWB46252.1 hypothetical protein DCC85_20185 [Paenibacillus sp. CAA11]
MKKIQFLSVTAVAALLVSHVPLGADAASTKTTSKTKTTQTKAIVHTVNNLAPIKITSKSTVRLSDVNILSQDQQNILTYTLTYQNNDARSLSLVDYWTKVKTSSGTTYNATVVTIDKDKKSVVPGASVSVTYTTKIAKSLKFSDLNFQIIKWDFSASGYESSLGGFKIPAYYTIATPYGNAAKLMVNQSPVKTKIVSASAMGTGGYNYVNIGLNIENIGSKLLDNPNMKYVLQTQSGTVFTLADADGSSYTIQSQDNRTVNLITKIPSKVNLNGLQLLVLQNDETLKSDLPVASLNLGSISSANSKTPINKTKVLAVGNQKITTNIQDAYVNQSFNKSDISIQYVLRNTGTQKVNIPAYTFEIKAGNLSYPLSVIGMDGLSLDPDEEQTISLSGNIPSKSALGKLELVVKTPTSAPSTPSSGEQQNAPVPSGGVAYSYPVAIYAVPELTAMQNTMGKERIIKNSLGTFGVTLGSVQRLPWEDGRLLVTKISIANRGTATVQLPDFAGAYKMDASPVATTTQLINSNTTKILGPGASSDVYVVTKVPTNLDFSQLQIILQQKLAADKLSNWVQFTSLGSINDFATIKMGELAHLETSGRKADVKIRSTQVYTGVSADLVNTEVIMKNLENTQVNLSQLTGYFETQDGQYYKAEVNQVDHAVGPQTQSIVSFSAKIPKSVIISNSRLIIGESITDNALTDLGGKSNGYVNAQAMELALTNRTVQTNLKNIELFPYTLNVDNVKGSTTSSGLNVQMKYDLKRDADYDMGAFKHKFLLEVTDSSGASFVKEIELEKDFVLGDDKTFTFPISDPIFATSRTGAFQFTIYDLYQGEKIKLASQAAYYDNSHLFD